jgi:hypothetical protein
LQKLASTARGVLLNRPAANSAALGHCGFTVMEAPASGGRF